MDNKIVFRLNHIELSYDRMSFKLISNCKDFVFKKF